MKVCKICGVLRGPHDSHRCSDNKIVKGRSSKMIPINTTYQHAILSDSGEYIVKNKPYIYSNSIYIDVYKNGLENISEVFKAKTVKELFKICSKLEIDYPIGYSKDFIHFDFEEVTDCDSYTGKPYIDELLIKFYIANKYEN